MILSTDPAPCRFEPLHGRSEPLTVIPSADIMILRLTTMYENGNPPLSPLGERVAHDGVFISRRGSGEGVPIFMAARNLALVSACNGKNQGEIPRCARNDSSGEGAAVNRIRTLPFL